MKKNLRLLKLAFLISFCFGLTGIFLTAHSYYRKLSLMSGKKQLEFMKNLPSLASDGSRYSVPAFTDDPALSSERMLKSELVTSYHAGKISLRHASVVTSGPPGLKVTLETILDARERYEKK